MPEEFDGPEITPHGRRLRQHKQYELAAPVLFVFVLTVVLAIVLRARSNAATRRDACHAIGALEVRPGWCFPLRDSLSIDSARKLIGQVLP